MGMLHYVGIIRTSSADYNKGGTHNKRDQYVRVIKDYVNIMVTILGGVELFTTADVLIKDVNVVLDVMLH